MIDEALTKFVQEKDPSMWVERHDTWIKGASVLDICLGNFRISRAISDIDRTLAQFDVERYIVGKAADELLRGY